MVPTGIKVAARRLRSRWDRDREAGLLGLRVYARGMNGGLADKGAASLSREALPERKGGRSCYLQEETNNKKRRLCRRCKETESWFVQIVIGSNE